MEGFSDWEFLTVSSTDKIKQAASVAAEIILVLTSAGSQTNFWKLSAMDSVSISTPYHVPSASINVVSKSYFHKIFLKKNTYAEHVFDVVYSKYQ